MRILLWHGYLLGGTGSNVYTRMLAREWRSAGHDVTVFCQDANADVRPDVGGLLPVFVKDRYDGYDVKLVQECTHAELDAWVEANARALRAHLPADLVFCNHVLLGGPVGVATTSGTVVPFAVKAHGSELEDSMRGNVNLARWGRDALSHKNARAVFVGSAHIRKVLLDICGGVRAPIHEIPPGVDVDEWRPASRDDARTALIAECERDGPNSGAAYSERLPDEGNAARLRGFLAGDRRTVVYFGKLMRNKGVHLLIEALHDIEARAVIVGCGEDRAAFASLASECAPERVLFTGALEHRHLKHLLAFADASVVPSIFPEAFGRVAAEAAAAGCPPLVARHSGLGEVAAGLEREYPAHLRHLASFVTNNIGDLREKLAELLALRDEDERAVRNAARAAAEHHWSWASVAKRVLDAAA